MTNATLRLIALSLIALQTSLLAQEFEFFPSASYDPSVPTLEAVVGHKLGDKITMHHEVERYIKALAAASPQVELVKYGSTWEDRSLYYLVVSSAENLANRKAIQSGLQNLANPDRLDDTEASRLVRTLPSVVWLAYGVHGNEISSTDAGLMTAYHLVASVNDTLTRTLLENSILIIDPMQNPDGRDRFINYYRQTRGRWPDKNQDAAEHRETWPGGRTNHYLFDMNRDWFALTQPETRGRVAAYLTWYPQVFVDLHEMGSNSTYYFAPPADPLNPEIPAPQINWLQKYGQNNAQWFDRMRFDYFTREVFDSFYPGYGEGWPMFHGSIGMTYEQASARGLVVQRSDETVMHYRESVQHHFISSLSTVETTARNRQAVVQYFYDYRKSAIAEGRNEEIKEFILPPGQDPVRSAKLAELLTRQGIRVRRATGEFSNGRVVDYAGSAAGAKSFPQGTYVVSLAQPAKRLAKTLLARHVQMDDVFIKEQLRRQEKRIGHQIYDVTGWSLPLLYDVECYMAQVTSKGQFEDASFEDAGTWGISAPAKLAYLIPWGSNAAARALGRLFREEIRVFSSDKSFSLAGRSYPRGTLIVKTKNNPVDLHARLDRIAREERVTINPTNSSWVTEGVNFGSGEVGYLKLPKIALAYNQPTSSYSAGWTRYLIEQAYGYPLTILRTEQIAGADLKKFNVLILPNSGGYSRALGGAVTKLKDWVRTGGTLVTYGGGAQWLTSENVALLATHRELKGGKPDKPAKESTGDRKSEQTPPDVSKPFDVEKAIQPEKEMPISVPGAILRVKLDTEHWLAFGYDGDTHAMVQSNTIFTPLKLDKGRNVGLYQSEDQVLASGFVWEASKKQIANKAYLMHQAHGQGHVIAFAEDPNFRGFMDGLNLLFLNAVFMGPSH